MGSHTEENSLGAGLCLSWTPLPDPEYFPEVCRAPLGKSTYIVNEMMQRMRQMDHSRRDICMELGASAFN